MCLLKLFVCIFNFLLPLVVNKDVQYTGNENKTITMSMESCLFMTLY